MFDDGPSAQQEDATSAIFSILRDFSTQHKMDMIDYAQVRTLYGCNGHHNSKTYSLCAAVQVEAMTLKKGFTTAQLQHCLQEYEGLGVIHVAQDRSFISFDG